jgi:hypothetical protein
VGILATGITLVALWAPPDPDAVKSALDRVLAEREYQTTLPGDRPGADDAGSSTAGRRQRDRTGRTADRRDPEERRSVEPPLDGVGAAGAALFWILLCVLAVLLVVWLASEWQGREKNADPSVARANAPPAPSMPLIPLDDIEALAAAGRFADAIHLLLLRTIGALTKASASLPLSLTSREILAAVPFRPGAREVLAGLVDVVEVSLFGGRPVGEADYVDCRARFDRFAALQSGVAA